MTDDEVTDADLALGDAQVEAIDAALAATSDDLTDTSAALVTANGAVAQLMVTIKALRAASFLSLDTPDERRLAAMLYNALEPIEQIAKGHRRMIESGFRRALIEEDALALVIDDTRKVTLTLPDAHYEVDGQNLYHDLKALVGTILTEQQLEDAVRPVVIYEMNHTKLNALHKNMGARVQAIIDRYRVRVPGDPAKGKVVIPKFQS
jgi:hypothetical protein